MLYYCSNEPTCTADGNAKMAENIFQFFFNRMSHSAMHEPTSTVDLMEKMAQKFFVNVY